MNIIEAISNNLSEIIKLSDSYIGRIYIDGKVNIHKPVDVRINRISLPLVKSDTSFIYDTISNEERIHKTDIEFNAYYPIGSRLELPDGVVEVKSYGHINRYNNTIYVDICCELTNKEYQLVETVNGRQIECKVREELNNIIESNEIIKTLLPQYDCNFLKFSNEDIDAIEKFNAMNVLSVFNNLEYQERYNIMSDINSVMGQNFLTLPKTVTDRMKEISTISITPLIKAGFLEYHSVYNPRYVFEGLIYIYENMLLNDESLYDKFYLVNKLDQRCYINIEKVNNILIFTFNTPEECNDNYILEIYNWSTYGSYIKYGIDNIKLYKVDKLSSSKIEIIDTKSILEEDGDIETIDGENEETTTDIKLSPYQENHLKVCTEIFSILSASNYNDMTLSEYYDNVNGLLSDIKTKIIVKEEDEDETSEA